MVKVFEDYFSELQADMVSICLEYVRNQGEKIYIYGSYEDKATTAGYFYKIHGRLLERHQVNKELPECNITPNVQGMVLDILIEDLKKMVKVCEEFDRPMPTEIKLVYDIQKNSVNAKYRYDIVYTDDLTKSAQDIENEWFEEIKAEA